jgi:hypothetical protein
LEFLASALYQLSSEREHCRGQLPIPHRQA